MITKREAAIISAYTGYMLGEFHEMHKLAEEVMGRPVWTHEFGSQKVVDELKRLVTPLYMDLDVEGKK